MPLIVMAKTKIMRQQLQHGKNGNVSPEKANIFFLVIISLVDALKAGPD